MAKPPDRALLFPLVDDYDEISEESLGMRDPEFHVSEDRLFDAIVDTPSRAVRSKLFAFKTRVTGLPGAEKNPLALEKSQRN
jgi:hypothetical protein